MAIVKEYQRSSLEIGEGGKETDAIKELEAFRKKVFRDDGSNINVIDGQIVDERREASPAKPEEDKVEEYSSTLNHAPEKTSEKIEVPEEKKSVEAQSQKKYTIKKVEKKFDNSLLDEVEIPDNHVGLHFDVGTFFVEPLGLVQGSDFVVIWFEEVIKGKGFGFFPKKNIDLAIVCPSNNEKGGFVINAVYSGIFFRKDGHLHMVFFH